MQKEILDMFSISNNTSFINETLKNKYACNCVCMHAWVHACVCACADGCVRVCVCVCVLMVYTVDIL